jgi:acyl-CoA synthetase (NDP forming)
MSPSPAMAVPGRRSRGGRYRPLLESSGNARKFKRIAPWVARSKPIVAVKNGRLRAGAASHTGVALAASDRTVDALFEQSGVVAQTRPPICWMSLAAGSGGQPLPKGNRVAVLTPADRESSAPTHSAPPGS